MGLFTTEGILRKKNFKDVPNKKEGLSNILKATYGNMDADDINIVNGAATYGEGYSEFFYTREYRRLKDIELADVRRPKNLDGEFEKVLPIQTINNRLSTSATSLGSRLPTGGGNGLRIKYYNWTDVYGTEDDIKSAGGGSYVEGQTSERGQGSYASPNTFVAPTDSEAFFEFKETDLAGKLPVVEEISWNQGVFNYGSGNLHPNLTSNAGAGIAAFSGYMYTGFDGATNTGVFGENSLDRLHIISKSDRYEDGDVDYAATTIPVIVKIWDVDQYTGLRKTSDASPISIARYAPGYTTYNDEDGTGGPSESPYVYSFSTTNFGGINDQLASPGSDASLDGVGAAHIVTRKTDGSPAVDSASRATSVFFRPDSFYAIEMYFIVAPRVARLMAGSSKSVFIEGYDRVNTRSMIAPTAYFFSDNPLAPSNSPAIVGTIYDRLIHSVPRSGSKVSGNVSPLNSLSPNFNLHEDAIGGESPASYSQLFSKQKVQVNYKPPHKWSEILKIAFSTSEYKKQFTSPHFFSDLLTTKVASSAARYTAVRAGNLVIDAESPRPRRTKEYNDSPGGSVFAPFTYIHSKTRAVDYVPLTKPTTGFKARNDGSTLVHVIDHVGLKGYGRGNLYADSTGGPYGNPIAKLNVGNQDCPNKFYVGEPLSRGDIIIFEEYEDSPYMRVYDSDAGTGQVSVNQLASTGENNMVTNYIKNVTFPFNNLAGDSPGGAYPFKGTHNGNDTPGGRNFFVYRHKGLVDQSLDGFCSINTTNTRVIEGLAAREVTTTDSPKIQLQRDSIISYDGDNIKVAEELADGATGGILGLHADYNGTSLPNGTLINKVIDKKFVSTIVISGLTGAQSGGNGTYELDSYPKFPHNHVAGGDGIGEFAKYYNVAAYGNPVAGEQFYKLIGPNNSPRRIYYESDKWILTADDGTNLANLTQSYSPFITGDIAMNMLVGSIGTASIAAVNVNSPGAPYEIVLTKVDSPFSPQPLTSDIKVGFGVTICESPALASVRYQCFPPTDTAPPFRATVSGIRSLAEEDKGSVEVSAASPGCGYAGTDITSITLSGIEVIGDYGNNTPGPYASVHGSSLNPLGSNNVMIPGGVIPLGASAPAFTYEKSLIFDYINQFGGRQRFSIMAAASPSKGS